MTEEIRKLLEKSDHALEVAEKLVRDGYPSDAASEIYYSMYYAAQALLKSEGIDAVKHLGQITHGGEANGTDV